MKAAAPSEAGKPIGILLRELAEQMTTLVRAELALAKIEMTQKGRALVPIVAMGVFAALLGLGAFAAITFALIAAFALVLQVWAAALLVAVIYGLVVGILAFAAVRRLRSLPPLIPEQTLQSVKEDVECATIRAKSGMRSR